MSFKVIIELAAVVAAGYFGYTYIWPKLQEFDWEKILPPIPDLGSMVPPMGGGGGGGPGPPMVDTRPSPNTAGGVKWFYARGPTTIVKQSRNEGADKRWSKNVPGMGLGFEATFIASLSGVSTGAHIGFKHWGPNHTPPCATKLGGSCCCWYDSGIRKGSTYLQVELKHPNNDDRPCPTCFKFPQAGLNGPIGMKWVVIPQGNAARRIMMWVDPIGLSSGGRPANQWKQAYNIVDRGQILPASYKAPMTQDMEVRVSDTTAVQVYGGGLMVRRLR